MKTFATIVAVAVLGLTGTWLVKFQGLSQQVGSVGREPLPVQASILVPVKSISRERQFSGTIVAARRTQLAFPRSARLLKVNCDEGDSIRQGDELAEIDARQLLTQVTQMEAQHAQQKAVLSELAAGPRKQTIAAMHAELKAVSADVELRKATLKRIESLFQRGGTSAQSLDEARLAWESLAFKCDAIAKQLDELQAGTRPEQITAQKAIVSGLEAQLQSLKIDLADSTLRASFSGTIVRRMVDEGDMLNAQQPVLELLETSRMEARIGIPSGMIGKFDTEDYHVLSVGDVEVTARLRSVVAQVDAATRTQQAVFEIDESQASQVADGQLVRLKFGELVAVEGFEVPLTALAAGSRGLWTLYVVELIDGQHIVAGRAVEVLHTNGDTAVIRGAVFEGEAIVADGVHRVVPGQRVSISGSQIEAPAIETQVGERE